MAGARDQRGFTLAELLVGFAILSLGLAAVAVIHHSIVQSYVTGSNRTESEQNARAALERIARELRQTPVALTLATATSLTLRDQDNGDVVTYALSGDGINAQLTRTVGGVASVMIGRLQELTFAYRDVNNNVLATPVGVPANVFRVDITVRTASEDMVAGGTADARQQITTTVRLRNL